MKDDARFRLGPSTVPGAGKGLFATKAIVKGEKLPVEGSLVRRNSLADRCTSYADFYKFRVGDYVLIPSGYAGMVNHSDVPNLEKVIAGAKLYLRSVRTIDVGEELFFRYSPYAQKQFHRQSRKKTRHRSSALRRASH